MNRFNHILIFIFSLILISSFVVSVNPYIVEGDSVYINDSYVYLSATPHTLTDSGPVNLKLTNKLYDGPVNIIFGFNTSNTIPQDLKLNNPIINEEHFSKVCNNTYDYTVNPNYVWYYNYNDCTHWFFNTSSMNESCDDWSKIYYNTTCYEGTKIVEKNKTIITKLGYNIHYYDKDDFNITGECCGYFPEDDKIVCKDKIAGICNPVCQQTSEDKNVYDEYCDIYDLKQNKIKLTTVGEYGYVEKNNIKLSKIKEKDK